jgi:hypothetical protein
MAYVVARPRGGWEIRESRATPAGPRSRTLATFRTLTPEVSERAVSRALRPLEAEEVRRAARRVGAPIASPAPDRAAAELLAELAAGHRPRPALRRVLLEALGAEGGSPTGNAEAAGAWIVASAAQRGEALRDLLLLVDRLPRRRRAARGRFPRIESRPA